MKYLLDTNVLLFLNLEPHKLTERVSRILQDTQNQLYLSLVSAWEIQIKVQFGKLALPVDLQTFITKQIEINSMSLLAIDLSHIVAIARLETLHRDPFDRLLIAQSLALKIPMLTSDHIMSQYPIETIW